MPWAAGTAQAFRQLWHADAGLAVHAIGVHFLDRGREQQVAAGLQEFFLIGGQRARVFVQVFASTELQRVDENARHHEIRLLRGLGHQGGVAAVQVAHGGYKADALAGATGVGYGSPQFADGFNGVHAENPCSTPGNVTFLTSLT